MSSISQNAIKRGFFVISGKNQRRIQACRESLFEKTKPIYFVLRSAFSGQRQDEEKEFEKTKPIYERPK